MRLLSSALTAAIVLLASMQASRAQPRPTTHPATTQLSPEDEKKLEMVKLEAEVAGLPRREFDSIEQAIQFRRQRDQLVATCAVSDNDALTRLLVRGAKGVLTLQFLGEPPPAESNEPRNFQFKQDDLTGPGSLRVITELSWTAGKLTLAHSVETDDSLFTVQLIQDPPSTDPSEPATKLYVNIHNDASEKPLVDLKLEATTFAQLCIDHPAEVEAYVRPILRDFKQDAAVFAPDPKAAWQVFIDDYAPDAATVERVNAVAKRLDAEDFRDREAALAALADIGQPAALVLMKADRSSMSPEKQSSVDTFLAPYLPLGAEEVKRLRESRTFLLDALSLDDASLRSLAWKRLSAVANVPPTAFNPNAEEASRIAAIAKLRATIASRPASTAPAQP